MNKKLIFIIVLFSIYCCLKSQEIRMAFVQQELVIKEEAIAIISQKLGNWRKQFANAKTFEERTKALEIAYHESNLTEEQIKTLNEQILNKFKMNIERIAKAEDISLIFNTDGKVIYSLKTINHNNYSLDQTTVDITNLVLRRMKGN